MKSGKLYTWGWRRLFLGIKRSTDGTWQEDGEIMRLDARVVQRDDQRAFRLVILSIVMWFAIIPK